MKKIIILLITIILTFSCKRSIENINITGKWFTYSKENGYIEFEIDTLKMSLFSHYMGNLGEFNYKLVNDTLEISNYKYPTEVIKKTDSKIIFKNTHQIDTLKRLKESTLTFHKIDNSNDSMFSAFYDSFERRAFSKSSDNFQNLSSISSISSSSCSSENLSNCSCRASGPSGTSFVK